MFDHIKRFVSIEKNHNLTEVQSHQRDLLPTLWLLGKTGAGKSSIIHAITGMNAIEIGNGFSPCTRSSSVYVYPQDKPLLRFLDTRGLSEVDYDATEDIHEAMKTAQGLVVVMKIDEPEQSAVLHALKQIKRTGQFHHLLLVHTAVLTHPTLERQRQIAYQTELVKKVWGENFTAIDVDFDTEKETRYHDDVLIDELTNLLPVIGLLMDNALNSDVETKNFKVLEKEILWHAGTAATMDLIPMIGLVSVPAIQAKMLHSLASQYDLTWNKRIIGEFLGTLGGSVALQYSIRLGARQLMKLVPVYGQTLGAATAAAMSFGATYGLGRAACYYFYHQQKGEPVSAEALRSLYKFAFTKGKKVSGYDNEN